MNIKDVDLNLLTVFHAIYESRSISAAAAELDLSQPGMSHALKRLRTQLKDKLFVRHGNGVAPTVYADSIAEPIRNAIIFLEMSLAPDEGFDPETSKRHFRLLLADFVEPLIMPALLKAVCANKNITFELLSPQALRTEDAILQGNADLVIHLQTDMMDEISVDPLFPIEPVISYRKGHPISQEPDTLAALTKYRSISPNMKPGAVQNFDKAKISQTVTRDYVCLVHSVRSIPALLAESDCIAFLPLLFAMKLAPRYDLEYLRMPIDVLKQDITLSWHRKNDTDTSMIWIRAKIQEIIEELKSAVSGLP